MTWLIEILLEVNDEILRNKAFNIAKNPKYDRYMETCFNGLQMF